MNDVLFVGNPLIVDQLYHNGSKMEQADSRGWNCLHWAGFLGNKVVVDLLLLRGGLEMLFTNNKNNQKPYELAKATHIHAGSVEPQIDIVSSDPYGAPPPPPPPGFTDIDIPPIPPDMDPPPPPIDDLPLPPALPELDNPTEEEVIPNPELLPPPPEPEGGTLNIQGDGFALAIELEKITKEQERMLSNKMLQDLDEELAYQSEEEEVESSVIEAAAERARKMKKDLGKALKKGFARAAWNLTGQAANLHEEDTVVAPKGLFESIRQASRRVTRVEKEPGPTKPSAMRSMTISDKK